MKLLQEGLVLLRRDDGDRNFDRREIMVIGNTLKGDDVDEKGTHFASPKVRSHVIVLQCNRLDIVSYACSQCCCTELLCASLKV